MKIKSSLLFAIALVCLFPKLHAQIELQTGKDVAVTDTESGKVRGFIRNGIYTYKGIPYAKAERFMAPTKVDAWEGVRSSTMYGPVAPLLTPTTSVMDESEFVFDHDWGYTSEDCLRINVWTPNTDQKKRPVLFWIHGGGYTAGSSQELPSYDGENLSKKGDVVVVSINHRLNVLGFLDLSAYGEKYKTSANNSILDIVAALEWVKANISNFGGDPNNVTIFGQSGGGAKVNNLMAMPKAKGLFHKAINQSGAMRSNMLEKEVTQEIGTEVLNQLGLSADQVDQLQTIPFEQLSAASSKALQVVGEKMKAEGKPVIGMGSLNWGPSHDGNVFPYQLLSDEAFELSKDIPLLIGTTKNEFTPFANGRFFNASEEEIMAHIKNTYKDKADDYLAAVKKAYPNDTKPSDLLDIDAMFRPGAVFQANRKSALKGGAPVYMYLFTWQSPVFDGKYKSLHCMELPFVFDNIERAVQMTGGGEKAHILAHKMSQAWINFAKTGDPNHDALPVWPVYNATDTHTMFLDEECFVSPQRDKEFLKLVTGS
ncbi:carboxylesterase/lipase family protein [Flagellimonas zhangzhouensis]|uniref:Carboxylic ester hydrolase n=1 Tax=Flagellimonas zhangzhouensis TaxID=1073328 RepID=A0A1H2XAZ0_9FLAO|nr:carboxylesterase family protein [Allomuricauda zhangzhouensis]SDQ30255.1 para-nitrobenzyl esterase [Allomuricauda zhangzhouensis]SDW89977.1 para-nitrobenzyl esterase [Allomuricauda zhangzhouensis]